MIDVPASEDLACHAEKAFSPFYSLSNIYILAQTTSRGRSILQSSLKADFHLKWSLTLDIRSHKTPITEALHNYFLNMYCMLQSSNTRLAKLRRHTTLPVIGQQLKQTFVSKYILFSRLSGARLYGGGWLVSDASLVIRRILALMPQSHHPTPRTTTYMEFKTLVSPSMLAPCFSPYNNDSMKRTNKSIGHRKNGLADFPAPSRSVLFAPPRPYIPLPTVPLPWSDSIKLTATFCENPTLKAPRLQCVPYRTECLPFWRHDASLFALEPSLPPSCDGPVATSMVRNIPQYYGYSDVRLITSMVIVMFRR
ncbi:hypothetical protein BU17DRAFT_70667 [Hysterangium stoloniferum]|nr:hypothetical protein BU17DRAFT_70667 [Hysterangium stoloniferum]